MKVYGYSTKSNISVDVSGNNSTCIQIVTRNIHGGKREKQDDNKFDMIQVFSVQCLVTRTRIEIQCALL